MKLEKELATILLIFHFSCKEVNNPPSTQKIEQLASFNRIFLYKKDNQFIFEVTHINLENEIKMDTISLICTGKKVEWDTDPVQYEIIWESKCLNRYLNETTGIIENDSEMWMHPPRAYDYTILELSAFPFISFPLKIGNTWNFPLKVGSHWGKKLGYNWDNNLDFFHSYTVKKYEEIDFMGKKIWCHKIIAKTSSDLGVSKDIFYYNNQFGFIKMMYANINGTSTNFKLLKIKNNELDFIRGYRFFDK